MKILRCARSDASNISPSDDAEVAELQPLQFYFTAN